MNKHLFLFTIGPVQSFIAQARKTQDLYAGSYLLSYLVSSTMDELNRKTTSCEYIFPHKKIKSKPNRFIAKIESEDIKNLGEGLESFVLKEFETIATSILSELNLVAPKDFVSQIREFIQVNWVSLPLDEVKYTDTYRELESYLGAVKNVRDFLQHPQESGRKCSLCGERNILFYRGRSRAYTPSQAISLNKQPPKYMVEGEGLCAVCFTKRFEEKYFKTGYTSNYPSTAEISQMDSLTKINPDLLNAYKEIFGKYFDYQLYYEENLTSSYFRKYNFPEDKLEIARKKYENISRYTRENKLNFSKYYAIILFDGDDMGKWLSGEYLNNEAELPDFHNELTEKLGSFSATVNTIIHNEIKMNKPTGKLIYAGGDDVLTFVNLNYLLYVLQKLRNNFPVFEDLAEVQTGKTSTASCGVCITHYKTPLSEVLLWARKLESEAKSFKDKNTVAIAVLKRSGEIRKTVLKWQYDDIFSMELLEDIVVLLSQNKFSNTFIKNLEREFGWWTEEENIESLLKIEMGRLIERSCMLIKEDRENKEDFLMRKNQSIMNLTNKLNIIYTKQAMNLKNNTQKMDNFLSFLDIAVFLAREVNKNDN